MSSDDTADNSVTPEDKAKEGDQEGDSLASKLSKELSNWRRRRTAGRPRRSDHGGGSYQSEPARTIKVRGHETLVIRKPKLASKQPTPPANPDRSPER
jgi:hypothetical protein